MSEQVGVRILVGKVQESPPLYPNNNCWFEKLTVETETDVNEEEEQRLSGIIYPKSISKW